MLPRGAAEVPPGSAVRGGLLLAAASGLAVGATFSPHGGPLLPFVAFAPLAAALARAARHAAMPPLSPFAQGFTTAVVAHGVGLYWMVPALSWRTPLAVPTYLLVLLLIGIVAGAACGAAAFLHGSRGWPLPPTLAACWTGFEWVAARAPGVPYAWLNAGSSLAWHPALADGAEFFGARFLTFWTVATGAFLAATLARWRPPVPGARRGMPRWFAREPGAGPSRSVRPVALALLALSAPAAVGHLRQPGVDQAEVVARVAVVQPGRLGGGLGRWLDPLRRLATERRFGAAVFPERFLGVPDAGLADFAAALGTDVVVGALDAEVVPSGEDGGVGEVGRGGEGGGRAGDTLWYNAALVQPPAGPAPPAYRKARLVPGLEAMGAWPTAGRGPPNRGYATGADPRPLPVAGRRVGVMICYDSAFEATARSLVRAGAHWLMVISNDDWLDPARPFRTTWAYWQHATHGRLRAIENRVSLIQVGATGYSFAVSPTGGGAPFALEPGAEGVAVLAAQRGRGTTLFTRTGDVLGLACLAVFAAGVLGGAMPAARTMPFTAAGRSATFMG